MSALGGAVLGASAAGGLLLVADHAHRRRRPSLEERVAPYVGSLVPSVPGSRAAQAERTGVGRLFEPTVRAAAGRLDALLGGRAALRRRLDRAGSGRSVDGFRLEQLAWAAAGFGVSFAVVVLALLGGRSIAPVAGLVLCVAGAVGGVLARDHALATEVRRREERVLAEFPAVAELLALAVAAGEGASGAVARVAESGAGVLATEFGRVGADVRTGRPFVDALRDLASRLDVTAVSRFALAVAVAVERGTPLADVLHAQAADAREARRRQLMELAGRREIAMLVPVVFLVLPITVVFALFPGFYGLSLNAP